MGKRGPAAKPTEQKLLEGTYRTDRAPHNEAKPEVGASKCPSWLKGMARTEYNRHVKMLERIRVMTEADRVAIAAFAYEFGEWRHACDMVEIHGAVAYSEKGSPYMSPWHNVANVHFKNMVKLMQEFGLTPASRTRIEAQPEEDKALTLADKLFQGVSQVG